MHSIDWWVCYCRHVPFPIQATELWLILKYMIYRSHPDPGSTILRTSYKSYYKTFVLVFMHIFWTIQFDPLTGFNKEVSQFMARMKHTVVKEMQEWGVTCEEGKTPMVFTVLNSLYQLMEASGSTWNVYIKWLLNLERSLITNQKIVSNTMWITCNGMMITW